MEPGHDHGAVEAPKHTWVFGRVAHEELRHVAQRRENVGIDVGPVDDEVKRLDQELVALGDGDADRGRHSMHPTDHPRALTAAQAGLVGLAFSGGGIRSATFNLGVLQALSERGVLRLCDYLSTVSGGGYIGSCLSSLLDNPDAGVAGDAFPFHHDNQNDWEEREEIKHLRRHRNYLAPNPGLLGLDLWRMIGLYVSGLALTLVFPFSMGLVLAYVTHELAKASMPIVAAACTVALVALVAMVLLRLAAASRELDYDQRRWRDRVQGWLMRSAATFGLLAAGTWLTGTLEHVQLGHVKAAMQGTAMTTAAGLLAFLAKADHPLAKKLLASLARLAQLLVVPLLFAVLLALVWHAKPLWAPLPGTGLPTWVAVSAGLFVVSLFINTNRISLHHFYRDRLSEAYVIKRRGDRIVPNEPIELRGLHAHANGPYHVINCTLNVPQSKNPELAGRGADFFEMARAYVGSDSTGYRRTDTYAGGNVRLATALAISGAAASPQMGTTTNPILRVVFALLNIRLNRWMPNPNPAWEPQMMYVWPYYFLKQMFGKGREEDRLLNLSDGGHHENLGVYALLKRRCRYIVACDAGADPELAMTDLANLQRKARIDMGIEIELDLTLQRRPKESPYVQSHCAVGRIIYPDGEPGYLVYVKSSLTGDEPEDLLTYQREHPSFPHESTGDQFFDEAQLESYRKLGQEIGGTVFAPELMTGLDGTLLATDVLSYCETLFGRLHEQHLRSCRESGHDRHRSSGLHWRGGAAMQAG